VIRIEDTTRGILKKEEGGKKAEEGSSGPNGTPVRLQAPKRGESERVAQGNGEGKPRESIEKTGGKK